MTERTLDWHKSEDPRNENHLLVTRVASLAARRNAQRTKGKGHYLDQGSEGACTGFGASNTLLLGPRHKWWVTNDTAFALYHEAQDNDEWPGHDYEGSSVNGAMRAMQKDGTITSYSWLKTLEEIRHALSYLGAVEMGTNWYSGMWNPDSHGLLHPTGSVVGGHAWALSGYRTGADGSRVYRMENSWGQSWGVDGGAYLLEPDLQTLLDGGECAIGHKVA